MLKKIAFLLLFSPVAVAQINPENITIARDAYGVPHIFAKTDAEVAYGLAWASAEDLFPTMQEMLYAGKGFAGRYQGKEGAGRDFLTHTLGIRKLVEERYEQDISPEFKQYLEGFCAGINAYVKKHWKDEKFIKKAFPITPKDVVASYVFSLSVISNAHKPVEKILDNKFDKEEVPMGSNAFAMNSAITEDGNTYLAINPHMPYDGPFSWYEAHLNSEEGLNIVGGLFPGGATIFLGANENLGWTHTWNKLDLVDTYKLKMHPKKKLWYEYDGQWLKLEKRPVWLKVKVAGMVIPVKMMSYWSKYGPTLRSKKGKMFYAIKCPAAEDIRVADQWFRMNKARNFTEFKSALEMMALGRFNIIYADRNDTIYYTGYGRIPDRDTTFNYKGLVPGNTSKTNWSSVIPLDGLAQYLNPECGYVFNTNNTPFNATCTAENLAASDFHSHMGYKLTDNNRSIRFQNLMSKHETVNWEQFNALKWDQKVPENHLFIQSMQNGFQLDTAVYADIADAIEVMKRWNYSTSADNMQMAFVYATTQKVLHQFGNSERAVEQGLYMPDSVWVTAIRKTKEEFMHHFNKLELPFGQVQTFTRSGKTVGLGGISDVLAATASRWDAEAGVMNCLGGDSYLQMVRFSKDELPHIESLMAGGNSDRPDSPHFNDQMELLAGHKTKKMTLDKAEILKNAVQTYHPK